MHNAKMLTADRQPKRDQVKAGSKNQLEDRFVECN